jgi:hypothetical protein
MENSSLLNFDLLDSEVGTICHLLFSFFTFFRVLSGILSYTESEIPPGQIYNDASYPLLIPSRE